MRQFHLALRETAGSHRRSLRVWLGARLLAAVCSVWATAGWAAAAELPAWLAGHWRTDAAQSTVTEEVWLAPAQGLMTGMSRTTGGRRAFFEFVRIEAEAGSIIFVAQPMGAPPTRFARIAGDADSVTFENAGHDFPQRVIYRRIDAGTLEGRIEGLADGRPRSETWRYRRVAD